MMTQKALNLFFTLLFAFNFSACSSEDSSLSPQERAKAEEKAPSLKHKIIGLDSNISPIANSSALQTSLSSTESSTIKPENTPNKTNKALRYLDIQQNDPHVFGNIELEKLQKWTRIKEEILAGPTEPDVGFCDNFEWKNGFDVELIPRFLPIEMPVDFLRNTTDIPAKKRVFMCHILPSIFVANMNVIERRFELIEGALLSLENLDLDSFIQEYGDNSFDDMDVNQKIDELLSRVQPIPISLALAQGIKESGWGTSRLSEACRNYFGQWQFGGPGFSECRAQESNQNVHLRKFNRALDSTNAYVLNLNTNPAYKSLRAARDKGYGIEQTKSMAIEGLSKYSTTKGYEQAVIGLMSHNKLLNFNIIQLEKDALVKQIP